jgi:uncharacterized YccA/Bax inhibitor family protein
MYPGVGLQAVVGTLSVFAVTLLLFKSGKVRATPKAMRFFMIATIGYAVFALINMVMMWTGAVDSPFGLRTALRSSAFRWASSSACSHRPGRVLPDHGLHQH